MLYLQYFIYIIFISINATSQIKSTNLLLLWSFIYGKSKAKKNEKICGHNQKRIAIEQALPLKSNVIKVSSHQELILIKSI